MRNETKLKISRPQVLHIVCVLGMFAAFMGVTRAGQDEDSVQTAKAEYRDPTPHRLVESPTFHFRDAGLLNIDAGGTLFISSEKYSALFVANIIPTLMIGKSLLNDQIYIEAGIYQLPSSRYPVEYPFSAGVRGVIFTYSTLRMGGGYQYYDIGYAKRIFSYSAKGPYQLHSIYGGLTWTPGRNSYVFNYGIAIRETGHGLKHGSFGANIALSETLCLLFDLGGYTFEQSEGAGWIWTGVRFLSGNVSIDVATMVLAGYTVKVGIAL